LGVLLRTLENPLPPTANRLTPNLDPGWTIE
jgi:hypothetical protein